MTREFYCEWDRGHIATTTPVRRSQFRIRQDFDAFCLWIKKMNLTTMYRRFLREKDSGVYSEVSSLVV
jgi:hypothetical protein